MTSHVSCCILIREFKHALLLRATSKLRSYSLNSLLSFINTNFDLKQSPSLGLKGDGICALEGTLFEYGGTFVRVWYPYKAYLRASTEQDSN